MLNGETNSHGHDEADTVLSSLHALNLGNAFECELEKCFKLHPDLDFDETVNSPNTVHQAQHASGCLRLMLDFLPAIDPFDWRTSTLFREFINSLSLDSEQKPNGLNFDLPEDEDLAFAFDHHSLITSQLPDTYDDENEPIKTAEEVIREIDLIMGHDEDILLPSFGEPCPNGDLPLSGTAIDASPISESDLENLSLNQLNALLEELEACVREYSAVLVQELAYREELDFEQEQKDVFIARLDEMLRRLERRRRRCSMPPISSSLNPAVVDTVKPFDYEHGNDEFEVTDFSSQSVVGHTDGPVSGQRCPAPVLSRAQSAAHAAVAAATSATALLKRQWHRLSRGPDELNSVEQNPLSDQCPVNSDRVCSPYERMGLRNSHMCRGNNSSSGKSAPHPIVNSSRAATIVRLRKWASRKASEALNSGTNGSFRALLRRTAKRDASSGMVPICIREARSAVTTPTSSQIELPTIPPTLTHSASGHLVGNQEISADILEYKNLTTTIPYHRSPYEEGPSVEQLQVFNELLLAILTNNPNLTPMLTDYILNVYAPADERPSKLPI
ncbi:hypothetical protein CRM22_008034 [Opisthorchis felineus]|uniref:Zygin n=1 Tax=Opisthorchis felineus TaxID=147828 RepID=A0A4S2LKZ9_OPIFE|nr:hypothetical protein CRM22_008034 [Opisthorchis felineus]TGZ61349.1 hypothetical protein CRM22_008034 [Opisthorchis felineus]